MGMPRKVDNKQSICVPAKRDWVCGFRDFIELPLSV
jgi:hypothetical protein